MKNKELFLEKRNILFAKSQEEGFVAIDVLKDLANRFELSPDEFIELLDYFANNNLDVLLPHQVYLRKLKNKQARVNFCYYVLFNQAKKGEVDVSAYDSTVAPKITSLLKKYIDHFLTRDEKTFVTLYFGLDTGKPVNDDDEAMKQLDWHLSRYVHIKESALSKFRDGDDASTLAKRIANITRFTKIDNYEMRTVKYGSKEEDTIIFVPMSDGRDVIGPIILMEKTDKQPVSIGFLKGPGQIEFAFTIYNDEENSYAVNFYNKPKRARPELYATTNQVCFGLYYPSLGYHGNQYIFKKGEKVEVVQSWEGDQSNSRFINYNSPDNIYRGLSYEPFKKGLVAKQEGDGFKRFIVENPGERTGIACQINDDGTMMIGQYMNGEFNGIIMQSDNNCENFRLGIAIDSGFVDDFYISVDRGIQSIFYYKKMDKEAIALDYSPLFLREEMAVVEIDEKDEVKNRIKLSNPLFQSAPLSKKASPDLKEGEMTPEEKLNSLIGLGTVKKHIARLKALFIKRKNDHAKQSLHMLFTGNPGTGKTEVARLLAGIMYDEGIITENKFIEVDRSGLVGAYIGQSEEKTKKVIESALGGVLFIDEAYSLFSGVDDSKDYGKVVMDALVKAMEDYRDKLCIIFAGYKIPMEKLLSMNPGFKSRISYILDFPDYDREELKLITQKFVNDNGYSLTEDALNELVDIVELDRDGENFGNARDVRNILENLYAIQAERTISNISDRVITIDDVNTYASEQHIIKKKVETEQNVELPYNDILRCSSKYDDPFVFTQRYVEEASVNIKILDKPNGEVKGEGSGFFITDKGLIATCAHVIDGAENELLRVIVNIYTDKGKKTTKSYSAAIVGFDKVSDVGLIQLQNVGDDEFVFYPLLTEGKKISLLSQVIMGGYPLGGERFEKISLNEGKAQSYNRDRKLPDGRDDIERLYVDLFGVPGNSGSGVIEKSSGICVGIFAGASVERVYQTTYELNYAIPLDYLWKLVNELKNTTK